MLQSRCRVGAGRAGAREQQRPPRPRLSSDRSRQPRDSDGRDEMARMAASQIAHRGGPVLVRIRILHLLLVVLDLVVVPVL